MVGEEGGWLWILARNAVRQIVNKVRLGKAEKKESTEQAISLFFVEYDLTIGRRCSLGSVEKKEATQPESVEIRGKTAWLKLLESEVI